MGLNSVQLYAKSLTTGVTSPLYDKALVTYINPPNPGKLLGPAAYVWVTMAPNRRQTAPRGYGFRKVTWVVNIWLMSPGKSTDPQADSAFACLVDAVVGVWVSTPMPLMYTDPQTGQETQFLSVGEEFEIEQSPVHSLSDQRLVLYEGLIRMTLKEALVP